MESGSLFLPLENKRGEIPKRIQLLPPGPTITGRDGRKWIMKDGEAVAAASNAYLPNHSIDENHAVDHKAPKGESSPAFGWFSNIAVEANGSIWADVEWTKRGAEAVSSLEYRYLSPVIFHNKKGEVSSIPRAALSNSPNLDIKSLNSQTPETAAPANPAKDTRMDKILAALGLAGTATEDDAVAAIGDLRKSLNAANPQTVDLAAYAPRTDLAAMEARAVKAETELTALNAAQFTAEAEGVIDQAIKDRKIAPASKEQYLSLCSTSDQLESLKKAFAASPALIGEGAQTPGGTPPGSQTALNAEERAAAKAAGYTEEEWKKLKAMANGQEAAK
ncbi:MAG: phage protease [Treponema sp.]|jgi:phage I-like protein|nr:phage protease [Treponema sp.]